MPHDPASPAVSDRVREKRERRHKEILRAALRAFRDHGYHATTLDDIAAQLEIQKTALYHYFPDKEAILYACHRESLAEIERLMRKARSLPSASEQLRYVIQEHVRVMTDALEGVPLAVEVPALGPERQAEIVAARDRYERRLRKIIETGMKNGEFRTVDPKIAVFVILGAMNWIARWYRPDGTLHAQELGSQYADHLVGGLTCG